MFLTKIQSGLSRTISRSYNNFILPASAQFFGTDLGKLNEKYHTEMIKKLAKSHESLTLPNLNLENIVGKKQPLSLQTFTEDIKTQISKAKIAVPFQGKEKSDDFSKELEKVDENMLSLIQGNNSIRALYEHVDYDNKLVYPKIIFAFRNFIKKTQKLGNTDTQEVDRLLVKLATSFECLSLGFYLHNQLENLDVLREKLKDVLYGVPSTLGMVDKYLKNEKLLLAGDFFHTKAAKLTSEFGIAEIPYYFALTEESLAKAIIKKNDINDKKEPYNLNNQLYVTYHESCLVLAMALKGTYLIMNEDAKDAQVKVLSEFALNFGTAWHIVSEYRKQEDAPLDTQKKQAYLIKDLLASESTRLHQKDDFATLLNLRQAHISQAEKSLESFTSNKKEVENFIHNVLIPIVAQPVNFSSQKITL